MMAPPATPGKPSRPAILALALCATLTARAQAGTFVEPAPCPGATAVLARVIAGPDAILGTPYMHPSYLGGTPQRVKDAYRDGLYYITHLGQDVRAPVGTTVRAHVRGTIGIVNEATQTVVLDTGWYSWVFNHVEHIVAMRGQRVVPGTPLGEVMDPRGAYRNPHVQITASAVRWPIPGTSPGVQRAISGGRAYGATLEESRAKAMRYSDEPGDAYARELRRCPVG